TPLVLTMVAQAGLPPAPYLLAVCMASNAGSVATFTGNPQNMIIQGASQLPYAQFAAYMALPAAVSTAVVIAVLLIAFGKDLPPQPFVLPQSVPPSDRRLLTTTGLILLAVIVAFFAGLSMAWSAAAGACALILLSGREPRP